MSAPSESNLIAVDFRRKTRIPEPQARIDAGKFELFSQWIEEGMVMVAFDARHPDVQVPPDMRPESDVRLNFSYEFQIPDFAFDEQGVSATLLFPEGQFFCVVPWPCVFGLHSYPQNSWAMWSD